MYLESDITNATNVDSESFQNDYTNIGPFIAGGIIGIFVFLGSVMVLVAMLLFMKRR